MKIGPSPYRRSISTQPSDKRLSKPKTSGEDALITVDAVPSMLATLYPLIRPLLFALDPERAHGLTLASLRAAHGLHLLSPVPAAEPVQLMGLKFANRVGLAAGLDKNAQFIDALALLGFGFIEVGT